MYKAVLFLVLLLFSEVGDKKNVFTSPLDIPLILSANFGELRPGHFHSGVDFKTNGVSGKRVYSVGDGYIYRISVGPGGFGNALYIRHSNGYSTVYGHLDRFMPDIEDYVTKEQYQKKSFSVNIFPDRNQFKINKGQQIAYSGNSGSSFGPHLHFEVRRSENENPLDPLEFFPVEDDIKPVINKLVVYPITDRSSVDGKNSKQIYDLLGSKGRYRISSNRVIDVSGDFSVGIRAWDFVSKSWNKCGIRSMRVTLDNKTVYKHSIDEFSFSESRYINSHIDYEQYISRKRYIQKAFLDPNNNLSIYDTVINKGHISLSDFEAHNLSIEIHDYASNKSVLNFTVQKTEYREGEAQEMEYSRLMPYEQVNEFSHHDIKLKFDKNSFYDTLRFDYSKIPGTPPYIADIHSIGDKTLPVHKFFDLSIKPLVKDSITLSKAGIVSIVDGKPSFIGGSMEDGFLSTKIREFGTYSIALDTLPPEISAINITDGDNLSGRHELKAIIRDDLSGIRSFNGYIDGSWALFEWDAKRDLLVYIFSKGNISPDSDHTLRLEVEDGIGNVSTLDLDFYW